jgi:hypothetical protein
MVLDAPFIVPLMPNFTELYYVSVINLSVQKYGFPYMIGIESWRKQLQISKTSTNLPNALIITINQMWVSTFDTCNIAPVWNIIKYKSDPSDITN